MNNFYIYGQSTLYNGYATLDFGTNQGTPYLGTPYFTSSSSSQATLFTLDATCNLVPASGYYEGALCGAVPGPREDVGIVQCLTSSVVVMADYYGEDPLRCTFAQDGTDVLQCTGGPDDLVESLTVGGSSGAVDGSLLLGPDVDANGVPVVLFVRLQ